MLYGMELNHAILDSALAENNMTGFSIIQVEDLIEDVKDDPDFKHDVYESILTAELQTLPNEMKDRCYECRLFQLEGDTSVCCELDCTVFKKAVEFKERFDNSFDICYHCPSKDGECLGFEYCQWRQMPVKNVKDVCFSPRILMRKNIISQESLDVILAEGIDLIDFKTYDDLEKVLAPEELRAISDYAFDKLEHFGINVEFTSHKATVKCAQVKAQVTRTGSVIGEILVGDKTIKFFVKKDYVSLQEKASQDVLSMIQNKVRELLGEEYVLPKKVYGL